MAKSTKHIVSAGKGPLKSKKYKKKPIPPKKGPGKPKPKRPKPMPYYPETGSNKKPPVQRKPDLKDVLIKIWNDRNSNNDGTKLNR